jgi:hypothetical protein
VPLILEKVVHQLVKKQLADQKRPKKAVKEEAVSYQPLRTPRSQLMYELSANNI